MEILYSIGRFFKRPGPKIVKIDSAYSIEDLPRNLPCQLEDGGVLIPSWTSNSNTSSNRFTIEVDRIPGLWCPVDRGMWLPAEVTLDLAEKTMSLLHGLGDDKGAEAMSDTRRTLEEIVASNPTISRRFE